MHEGTPILVSIGVILLVLFVMGYVGGKMKIPGVILYIFLGLGIGSFITENELLHTASEIGIVLLFFLLGLDFPLKKLKNMAFKVWKPGLLDVALNFGMSTLICLFFGLDLLTSFLIGGVLYATSSSISAKLLESTKRLANAESEYILAILIFEDVVAPIIVAVLIGLASDSGITGMDFVILLGKIMLLTSGAMIIGRYGFTRLEKFFERLVGSDIFIMLTVGIALSYAGIALLLGLSEVLGAFLAGIMLAETKRSEDIEQVTLPVRDLLLPIFFMHFGTTIDLGEGVPYVGLLLTLIGWALLGKILVGMLGGRWYGLTKRVALRAGFSLTPRGEFSVVIASIATGATKLFSSVFILVSAILGIVLFILAPKLTNMFYEKKRIKKNIKLKVPS
ncbi:cation:proton antiporter [Sutcliffiella horikoshii]|uniref:Cation:proton antiporter n=1 Tax=Sutcliffiella horikoshii TaxID=79883 RepID=A0A5D4T0P3_9BACI|nr:cation:proton antiporter [Sutcliffiella horikoshii]TYS68995.1 cation:proton antiporter [Sutcliffiella horikoshii]